jgi:hypothetical protein
MQDLYELEIAELDVNRSLSSSSSSGVSMAQWVMAFNLTADVIQSVAGGAETISLDCPPDYFYYSHNGAVGGDGGGNGYMGGRDEVDSAAGGIGMSYDSVRYVVDVYAVSVLCAFGFVGNTLSIAVLRRDRLTGGRDAQNACTSCLLQALAAINTVYLAACLIIQPAKTMVSDAVNWQYVVFYAM